MTQRVAEDSNDAGRELRRAIELERSRQSPGLSTKIGWTTFDEVILSNDRIENVVFSDRDSPSQFTRRCVFRGTTFRNCSFNSCKISGADFRNCYFESCDFKFAQLDQTWLEDSEFNECDFFLAAFLNEANLLNARIVNCSLTQCNTVGARMTADCLRYRIPGSTRLRRGIVQEDRAAFAEFHRSFLKVRNEGGGIVFAHHLADIEAERYVADHYTEAESVYRSLSGSWRDRGLYADASWAYVRAKRMQKHSLSPYISLEDMDILQVSAADAIRRTPRWFALCIADVLCRFGDSILLPLVWMIGLITFTTASFYWLDQVEPVAVIIPRRNWGDSVQYALGSLVNSHPETLKVVGFGTDLLSTFETFFGIVLAALLGFVIASKMREG